MSISSRSYKILNIIELANSHIDVLDMRDAIAEPILDLLGADQFASFCWNDDSSL